MKRYLIKVIILSLIIFLSGCSSNTPTTENLKENSKNSPKTRTAKFTNSKFQIIKANPKYQKKQALLEINTYGHTGLITDILVTKDKSKLITSSKDKTVKVWDIKTGNLLKRFDGQIDKGNLGDIFAIALSENEKYLATAGYLEHNSSGFENIRLYDYKTGKLEYILQSHNAVITDLSFSKDGKYLASSSTDKTIKIWDIENKTLKTTINFHTSDVYSVNIEQRANNYIITSTGYDNTIAQFDLNNNRVLNYYETHDKLQFLAMNEKYIATSGYEKKIYIFDKNLNILKSIKTPTEPSGLTYSKDGKFLLSGTSSQPNILYVYDSSNNYKVTASFKKFSNVAYAVNFIDNNRVAMAGGNNNDIYVWNTKENKVENKIEGLGKAIWKVGLKGDTIAFGKIEEFKDVNNRGVLEQSFNIKSNKLKKLTSLNFNFLKTEYKDYKLMHKKGGAYKYDNGVLLLKKGLKIIAYIQKNEADGHRHRTYGFYKDYIISSGDHGHIVVYNFKGEKVANLVGHSAVVWSMAIENDRLVTGSDDQTIKVWNLSKILDPKNKIKEYVNLNWFDDSWKQFIKLNFPDIDITKKGDIKKLYDSLVKRRDPDASKLLKKGIVEIHPKVSLFVANNNEWIKWTDEGYFDSSKNASKYIGYHINQGWNKEAEFISVDNLYDTFYRPDLVQKSILGEDLSKYSKNINIQNILKGGLAPEITFLTNSQDVKNPDINLTAQICPKDGGFDNLAFLINDVPISVTDRTRALRSKKKAKRKGCFLYSKVVSLASGNNKLGVKATNKRGTMHSNTNEIEINYLNSNSKQLNNSKLEGLDNDINNLHILTIAINDYKNKDLKLKYSINDADKIVETIKRSSQALFNKIYIHKLYDKEVTKKNIHKIFDSIKLQRNDVFLLYIAGHGVTDAYNGKYYYLPVDYKGSTKNLAGNNGISQDDLMLGLSKISALKSLVLLDTCNSGSFIEAEEDRKLMQKVISNRLAKATGRATISASSKFQVALEGYEDHGVFTFTAIEALKGKDSQNEKVTISQLSEYIQKVLPSRTYTKWKYRQIPQSSMYGVDFNISSK